MIIKISVGNVVRSVGFGIYRLIIIINTEIAIEIVKKRSKTALGRGTMMIAMMAITKKTSVKSFDFPRLERSLFILKAASLSLAFAKAPPRS